MELTDFPSYLSMSKNGKTKKNSGKSNAADVVQGKNFLVISLIICILFYLFLRGFISACHVPSAREPGRKILSSICFAILIVYYIDLSGK